MSGAIMEFCDTVPKSVIQALVKRNQPFTFSIDVETSNLLIDNGFLLNKETDELEILKDRLSRCRRGERALGIGIAPTMNCNFRCIYCYQDHEAIDMPISLQDAVLRYTEKNIHEREYLRISWFGGEPLLRIDILEYMTNQFLKLCKENSVHFIGDITTNGYLLSQNTSKILRAIEISSIQITLDGPAEAHDKRRFLKGKKPTFDKILRNLFDAANIFDQIIIRINIDKQNYSRISNLLDDLIGIRKKITLAFRPATSTRTPEKREPWCLTPHSFLSLDRKLNNLALEKGFQTARGYAIPGTSFCSGYQKNSFIVDPHGGIHRCPVCVGREQDRFGVLLEQGEIKIIEGLQTQWDQWDPFQDQECRQCKALPICMGGCLWFLGHDKEKTLQCSLKDNLIQSLEKDYSFSKTVFKR